MSLICLVSYFYKLDVFALLFFNWQNSCFKSRRNNTLRVYQVQCYRNTAMINYVSMQFFVFKFISLWTYFYWHGSNTEYAVNIIFFLKKNAGDKYAQKSIHWSLVIQINFPNQRLHNKLSWTVCKWSKLDLRQRKAEGRLVLIRCETVPLPLTRVSFFWKVCVKKISNSIKRFNQITTLYLKKRVISNRNLISENIYVLEGLLNVSLTGHTSAAYLITNSNIWLFCLSFRYLSLPCLFPIVDFFSKMVISSWNEKIKCMYHSWLLHLVQCQMLFWHEWQLNTRRL